MRVEDSVRRFILDELGWNGADELTDDYRLLGTGVLDSIGIVHVMSFLEDEYEIQLFDQEVDLRHFGSIESIARLVRSMVSDRGATDPSVARSDVPVEEASR